jgi:hypothetical protein
LLDLNEMSLVEVQMVRFLLSCEMRGIRIAHWPAYICEWIDREEQSRD